MVGGGFCDPALLRPGSSGLAISRGPEGHPHVSRRGDSWGTTWGEPVASAWKLTRPHLPCWPRPCVLLTACSRGRQRGCVISCLFLHNLPGVVFGLRRSAWRSLEAPCPIEAELVAGGNDGAVTGARPSCGRAGPASPGAGEAGSLGIRKGVGRLPAAYHTAAPTSYPGQGLCA